MDQVTAAQSQCGNFVFGEQYHLKVLGDDGLSSLKDYFNLGTDAKREAYNEKARQLVCARLIINNSLSNKTRVFLREQYIVNHSNYPDTVVEAVAMITSFGNDSGGGKGGKNNNNTNKNPDAIVSIHLAEHGDDYSDDDDGSVGSFESTANDQGTNDDSESPDVSAPVIDSEFRNDNSDENIETSDNGDGSDDDDDTTFMTGNNNEGDSVEDSPEPDPGSDKTTPNDNNSSTREDDAHAWAHLRDEDDADDDPGDFDEFCSDYNLDNAGVFDNDEVGEGEGFCCMTVSNSLDPQVDDYSDDNILLQHGVFDTGGNPSIHPNFFHGTLNNSIGQAYVNEEPISKTNILHCALLKSSLRILRGDTMKSIEHYDALRCKFQKIGIHNSTDYFNCDSSSSLQLLLSSHGLPLLYPSTIESINLELIFASQLQKSSFSGNVITEVCNIDTDTYNEELGNNGKVNLINMCLQTANLQQKSFPNKWTNAVMRKLNRAGIRHPCELKDFILNKTLNSCLKGFGDSGFHQTTQQGFLDLINGNEDFR